MVINFQRKARQRRGGSSRRGSAKEEEEEDAYIAEVLLRAAKTAGSGLAKPRPCGKGDEGEMKVMPLLLDLLDGVSSIRVFIPKDLRTANARDSVWKSLKEARARSIHRGPLGSRVSDRACCAHASPGVAAAPSPLRDTASAYRACDGEARACRL